MLRPYLLLFFIFFSLNSFSQDIIEMELDLSPSENRELIGIWDRKSTLCSGNRNRKIGSKLREALRRNAQVKVHGYDNGQSLLFADDSFVGLGITKLYEDQLHPVDINSLPDEIKNKSIKYAFKNNTYDDHFILFKELDDGRNELILESLVYNARFNPCGVDGFLISRYYQRNYFYFSPPKEYIGPQVQK